MRRLLLLVSVLLLGACWAVAQDATSPSSNSNASSGQTGSNASGTTTVQGCLSGSSGNFTLTDKHGNSYQLTGDTAKLSEHVGHEVKVTGTTSSPASAASGGSAANTAGAAGNSQTLEVSSMKHISKTCQSGGAMSK